MLETTQNRHSPHSFGHELFVVATQGFKYPALKIKDKS